ncbi:Dam family site-specific DNA-(adenine-N6)-methyltransferase [Escherichia coli]|nr:Dam family site-specific DNA-(adenine-N6)-methyltransferase [Escherichia coli]EGI4081870.1 Dam family site-specific DNA-(adenine-N6)-methyltransferase [Escherichia coli]
MSEVTDLVVIEKQNAMAVFTSKEQLDPIIEAIEKEARTLVPDLTTKKGRDAIASMAHKVARSKTYIDNAGKDLVAELKALPKQIDESRRIVRERLDAVERAAALLYLNRHCFNGLIRYNLDGFFNVGFGKYKAPYFPEEEIRAFKRKAHACVFMNAGFRRTIALAGDGDVVYCDPPYEPLPGTAGFTNYAAGGFSWDSQVELTESCVAAHQRGAKVVISNSTAPRVIELYEQHGFTLHRVSARRAISSKGSTRETASDVVATLGVQ